MTGTSQAGLPAGHPLLTVQRGAGAVGVVGAIVCLVAWWTEPARALESWLVAWLYVTGIALGSLALLLIHHVTGGAWGVVIRRPLEAAARTIPLLALLFLPVALGAADLYPWAAPHAADHDALLRHKAAYLNVPFFCLRAAIYFAVWTALATLLGRWSVDQDANDPAASGRLHALARGGLVVAGLTMTFAAIDWGMSLEPHWFSTIYGVLFIVGAALSALSFTIVLLAALAGEEPFTTALQPVTIHDLGKLLLAFTMLWGYVNFSQFLIVWSGNISEETPFYLNRMHGGWNALALLLIVFHFALPFALLLSRSLKRNARALAAVATLMLLMQLVDLYWLIGPDLVAHGEGPVPLRVHWMDLAAVLGLGGVFVVLFSRQLRGAALLPLGEPALSELVGARAEGH